MYRVLFRCLIPIILCVFVPHMQGQESAADVVPFVDNSSGDSIAERTHFNWQVSSARQAIREGFPAIAIDLLEDVLSRDHLIVSMRDELSLDLATACIADGKFGHAFAALRDYSTPLDDRYRVLMALVEYEVDSSDAARDYLDAIDITHLSPPEMSWYFLLQYLLADEAKDNDEANSYYQRALELASSNSIRIYYELIRARNQLKVKNADEALVADLRIKLKDMQGQSGAFDTSRLLAIALAQLDRKQEAVDLIEDQLRYIGVGEATHRSRFYLLLGLILGENSGRGRIALQQVLLDGYASRQQQEMALSLLARAFFSGDEPDGFTEFLDDLLSREKPHPLEDELLIFRSRLYLSQDKLALAETDAQKVLEEYPGSSLVDSSIRILAYLSWKRTPHQYRTAANYLTQLRNRMVSPLERAALGVLAADCLFLNGDYASAADAYGTVLREGGSDRPGVVLYQRVLSELRSGRIDRAIEELDTRDSALYSDMENRWKAEWNLIHTLRDHDRVEEAFSRLRGLLNSGPTLNMPVLLRLRLMWLEVQLSVEMRDVDNTPSQADSLLALLGSMGDDELPKVQRDEIAANTMLLKAEAYYILKQSVDGAELFRALREQYPQTEATAMSYLLESRYLSSEGSIVDAQRLLIALVDEFSGSTYAPIALWEAALNAEMRGTNSTYQEAISLLERLVTDYPKSSLTYQARLKQADLSRKLNDFGTALIIYEDLINSYPDNPNRSRAEMSRADCFLAQSSQVASRRDNAISIYEKIADTADVGVDMRLEAGFKWAMAAAQSGEYERAASLYWMVIHRVLTSEKQMKAMGPLGRYWMSRSIFELGALLEETRRYDEARKMYEYVLSYKLPGQSLAESNIKRIGSQE
jgi:tetratricopeptide (TPR) repeat protein